MHSPLKLAKRKAFTLCILSRLLPKMGKIIAFSSLLFLACIPQGNAQAIYKKVITDFTFVAFGKSEWVDLDNDDDLDMIFIGQNKQYQGAALVYENVAGTFTLRTTSLPGVSYGTFATADYDKDGDTDILITGNTSLSKLAALYRNDGNFVFQQQQTFTPISSGTVVWFDADNDQDLDIVMAGNDGSNFNDYGTYMYVNTGAGFTRSDNSGLPECLACAIACADANGDGRIDIMMSGVYGTTLHLNNGNLTFAQDTKSTFQKLFNGGVKWGDFDRDGDLDLLSTGLDESNNGVSLIYENKNGNSKESLVSRPDIALKGLGVNGNGGIRWYDYDSDGDLDILLTGRAGGANGAYSQTNRRYANVGNEVFVPTQEPEIDRLDDMSLDAGDFDNDGDPDLSFMGYLFTQPNSSSTPLSGYFKNTSTDAQPKSNTKPQPPLSSTFTEKFFRREIRLQWGLGADAETPLDGLDYNFYLRSDAQKIITPAVNLATGYVLTTNAPNGYGRHGFANNVPEGTLYYAVQAVDGSKAGSVFSAEKSFYHFNGPESVSAEIIDEDDVKLTWLDRSALETNYNLTRSLSATTGFAALATLPQNATTYTDHFAFQHETYYYYRVNAYNAGHASPYDSLVLMIAEPPSNLVAQAVNASRINVSWKDNSQYETSILLERRTTGGQFQLLATLAPDTESYVDTNVTPCTDYQYRVRAVTANGSLLPTTTATAHTNCLPTMANFTLNATEDTPFTFAAADFTTRFSDPDVGDQLKKVAIKTLPTNGRFLLGTTLVTVGQELATAQLSNLRFEPDANYNGTVSFVALAHDGTDYSANTTTVTLVVAPANDPPSFSVVATKQMDEDFPVDAYVTPALESIPYEIGDVINFSLTPATSDFVNIALNPQTGQITFTARKDLFGQVELTLTANDGHAENNVVSKKIIITVRPVNDPPVWSAVSDIEAYVSDVIAPVLITVTDVDNPIGDLRLAGDPTDETIIVSSGISFSTTAGNTYMKLMQKHKAGKSGITLSATDGSLVAFTYFSLTLIPDTVVTAIEHDADDSIVVSPNPFTNSITVTATNPSPTRHDAVLTDLLGRNIVRTTFLDATRLDTDEITPGIYLLEIINDSGVRVQRRVVKR
ncbi:T9SS C-terminal target domain-containing protein [Chryseolinea soli]|uniref:T9SS C-terminal target domain-containing protein n=2 Tax=Chryseolinea soli TaxID=2321403 RepID=A0A385SJ52_9BACT|nr:T9SS C-terminal target domain-containing protein [Chryseolinea soli]